MDKDAFTLQAIRQDLIDNNLQAKAIIHVSLRYLKRNPHYRASVFRTS